MNCYFYMPVLDLSVLNNWNPLKIFSISLLAGDDDVPFRVKGDGTMSWGYPFLFSFCSYIVIVRQHSTVLLAFAHGLLHAHTRLPVFSNHNPLFQMLQCACDPQDLFDLSSCKRR
ncbi:hypothetical protein M6B38_233435 [Iris pallida]|uniref:Uncharacterized protein n=1 Tax=Iris pallida TaxID=29817 RepID=A0AAX6DQF9_IRIPA|nr:hypothetical protein M6B38_233430 [Iris pallida]KAJ6793999.1 hypothetical protein M6B38_233435 [Iris pallida]